MPRTGPEHEDAPVALEELGETLGVETRVLVEYLELGLVAPAASATRAGLTAQDIARLVRALRLARELELHAAAAATLVELLEERDELRRRLACLEHIAGNPM